MKKKPYSLLLLVFTTLMYGCYELTVFNGVPIRQYASEVIDFSSHYTNLPNYTVDEALGEEDVFPNYGDLPKSWASLSPDDQREFLVLGFEIPQTVITIEIFETNNPGAIDTVYLRSADTGKWKVVYSKPVEKDLPEQSRKKSIFLVETPLVDAIRIALNSPEIPSWNEIDAVAITGQREN